MLLKASRAVGSLLFRNAQPYGITPQVMHNLSAELLLDTFPKSIKRTKTVCTIG